MPTRKIGRRKATYRTAAGAFAATTAVVLSGMSTAPAQSVVTSDCPATFPEANLTDGQAVNGLTVSTGTTPDGFTGTVLGVLKDGIAPGIDMIMMRLTSTEIDKAGIWQGMSGSPVYAADGRLIGAVSYGLAFGPSPVAGVTPAADMRAVLARRGAGALAAAPHRRVAVPSKIAARVVADGSATQAAVDAGLTQLRLPFGISGLSSDKRLRQVAKRLDLPGVRTVRMGTATAGAGGTTPMTAGGNLAASLSYGDVTAAALGTATLVCGNQVVGFGHPFTWSGPATLSLHGADALYIQEDPTLAGFKVGNIGDPVGIVDQDRMAGIAGAVGGLPPTSDVTATVTSEGRSRTGATHISVPEMVPDLNLSHMLADLDRMFDGVGAGSASMSWTLTGTRGDGSPFSVQRSDLFASKYDLTFSTALDQYFDLSNLESNNFEDVTINTVDSTADLSREYLHATIDDVKWRQSGGWHPLTGMVPLVAGQTAYFKAHLTHEDGSTENVVTEMPVRRSDIGSRGLVSVAGGNRSSDEGFLFFRGRGSKGPSSLDDVIAQIENAPHHDDVVADLELFGERSPRSGIDRQRLTSTGTVLDGRKHARVRIVG